jgi:hypothetical protein
MHLQPSKVGKSGGPQYWLPEAPKHILENIQRHKKRPVILQTPYGPVETAFNAVDPDHKVVDGKIVPANAQHFRIQKGDAHESIGEAIRRWFALDADRDFESITIDIAFDKKSRFILTPTEVHWRNRSLTQIMPSTRGLVHYRNQLAQYRNQRRILRQHRADDHQCAARRLCHLWKIVGRHAHSLSLYPASRADSCPACLGHNKIGRYPVSYYRQWRRGSNDYPSKFTGRVELDGALDKYFEIK